MKQGRKISLTYTRRLDQILNSFRCHLLLLLFLLFTLVNPGREHHVHMCDYKNKKKMPQQLRGASTTVCKHTTISSITWVHTGNVAAVESSFGLIKPS